MIVIDTPLLATFREAGPCEHCHRWSNPREPHHLHTRGFGGGQRVDIVINLMGLCLVCHRAFHDGNIPFDALLQIVAKREGVIDSLMDLLILQIRNAAKGSMSKAEIQKAIQELRTV